MYEYKPRDEIWARQGRHDLSKETVDVRHRLNPDVRYILETEDHDETWKFAYDIYKPESWYNLSNLDEATKNKVDKDIRIKAMEKEFNKVIKYEEDQQRLFDQAGGDCVGIRLDIKKMLKNPLVNDIPEVKNLKEAMILAEKQIKQLRKKKTRLIK